MKSKKIIKLIKKEALKLEPKVYQALEKYHTPRLIDGEYKIGEVVACNVNHARRVKRAYKKWGLNAVGAYFTVFQKKDENLSS